MLISEWIMGSNLTAAFENLSHGNFSMSLRNVKMFSAKLAWQILNQSSPTPLKKNKLYP